jgi:hypothetical protein
MAIDIAAIHKKILGERYLVIEVATGKPVGDGQPMPLSFAEYVLKTRDWFNKGDFVLQAV